MKVPAADVDGIGEVQSGGVREASDGVGRVGVEEDKFGGVICGGVVGSRVFIGEGKLAVFAQRHLW